MQLTVKLIQLLPLQTGISKNGEWKKQDIIVETEEQYSRKICISVWGDKINNVVLEPGAMLKIDFDVESREFNGRWYTDVKAWKIENLSTSVSAQQPTEQPSNTDPFSGDVPTANIPEEDILPF